MMAIENHSAAAGEAFAGIDLVGDAVEQGRAGMGIGIDEDKPVSGSGGSAGVAGASDLVDGFENNFGSGGAGDFGGCVSGVVVADDEFGLPIALMKNGNSSVDVTKGFAKAAFFIESGDNDRDFQCCRREIWRKPRQ